MFNRSSYPVSKHIRPVKSTSELIHPDFDSGRFLEPKETDQYLQYITFLLLRPVRNFREKWSQSSMASVKSAQTTRERSSRVWWTHVWQVFSRGGVFLLWPSENSAKKHRRERWLSERTVELFVSDRNGFLELFLILCLWRLSFYHVLLHYRHLLVITVVQMHRRPSVLRRLQRKAQHTSVYKVYNQVYFHLHGLYTYSDPLHMNTIS